MLLEIPYQTCCSIIISELNKFRLIKITDLLNILLL